MFLSFSFAFTKARAAALLKGRLGAALQGLFWMIQQIGFGPLHVMD